MCETFQTPGEILTALWRAAGLDPADQPSVTLTGAEPAIRSSFRLGAAAQAIEGAVGAAAVRLHQVRTGESQSVAVAMADALAEFASELFLSINDAPPPALWDPLSGLYRCGDGRWLRVHTNFAHHRAALLDLLGCDGDRPAVAAALALRSAADIEAAAPAAGVIAGMERSAADWAQHPQGQIIAAQPLILRTAIGEAALPRLPPGARPLAGVRVLDLTRIIAGPVGARTLAAHGAEVLRVLGPDLPTLEFLDIDTGRGKRCCHLDLRRDPDRESFRALVRGADIVIDAYRPGALAGLGFGPDDLARLRPGLIQVSLSAYGTTGPWGDRRGFDSIVQTVIGLNRAEGIAAGTGQPTALPLQALDHGAGHLVALAAIAGLIRRQTGAAGGAWLQISLARVGDWLQSLGRLADGFDPTIPLRPTPRLEETASGFGRISAVRPAVTLEATPAHWNRPPVRRGSDPPRWAL